MFKITEKVAEGYRQNFRGQQMLGQRENDKTFEHPFPAHWKGFWEKYLTPRKCSYRLAYYSDQMVRYPIWDAVA